MTSLFSAYQLNPLRKRLSWEPLHLAETLGLGQHRRSHEYRRNEM